MRARVLARWSAVGLLLGASGAGCGSWSTPAQVTVRVDVTVDGIAPAEVEARVVEPLEEAVGAVAGVRSVVALAEGGRARLFVAMDVRGSVVREIEAMQAVSEQVFAVDSLPEVAGSPMVYLDRPTRVWVRTAVSDEDLHGVIGGLSRQGIGASEVYVRDDRGVDVWELQPARLREGVVTPTAVAAAVERALAGGEYAGAKTAISEERVLDEVARRAEAEARVVVDGEPGRALRVESADAEMPGWAAFDRASDGLLCARSTTASAPASGTWLFDGAGWIGRVPAASELPGISSWTCSSPVARVALVAQEPEAPLKLAAASLQRWSGAQVVLPVPMDDLDPEVRIELDPARASALGLTAEAAAAQLAWSGRVRTGPDGQAVVLRWPSRDLAALSEFPLTRPDGVWVPLQAVATISLAAPPAARRRVNGRRAEIFDVVLAPGARLSEVELPAGVGRVELGDQGPDRVWR